MVSARKRSVIRDVTSPADSRWCCLRAAVSYHSPLRYPPPHPLQGTVQGSVPVSPPRRPRRRCLASGGGYWDAELVRLLNSGTTVHFASRPSRCTSASLARMGRGLLLSRYCDTDPSLRMSAMARVEGVASQGGISGDTKLDANPCTSECDFGLNRSPAPGTSRARITVLAVMCTCTAETV